MKLDLNIRNKLKYLYWYIYKLDILDAELVHKGYNLSENKFIHIHLSRSVTSQLIYFLINEEISNNYSREGIQELFEQIGIGDDPENINHLFIANSHCEKYTRDLFVNNFNSISQSNFFDFQFSMWSSFELTISHIFDGYINNSKVELDNSHYQRLKKFLDDSVMNNIQLTTEQQKIINDNISNGKKKFLKKFPKYITSDDKLNYIFKLIHVTYDRDINNDKKILHFIRALRNTTHNNGLHTGNNIEINIQNYIYKLNKNKIGSFGSDINIIKLYFELLEIYKAIIIALPISTNKS